MTRHRTERRKRERISSWKQQQPAFFLALAGFLVWAESPSSTVATESSSSSTFTARLPNQRFEDHSNSSRRGWNPGDGASDDGGSRAASEIDEIESSSEDESLWGPLTPHQQDAIVMARHTSPSPSPPPPFNQAITGDPSESSRQQVRSSHSAQRTNFAPAVDGMSTEDTSALVSSQPLKTLQKLQNMLEETDYLTTSTRRQQSMTGEEMMESRPPASSSPASATRTSASLVSEAVVETPPPRSAIVETGRLWTSKDRTKYKKQQQKLRKKQEEMRRNKKQEESRPANRLPDQPRSPPIHLYSDDDCDLLSDDTDDGLGYSLPNVPVYFSDAEGDSDPGIDSPVPLPDHQLGLSRAETAAQKLPPTTNPTVASVENGFCSAHSIQSTHHFDAPQHLSPVSADQQVHGRNPQSDGATPQQFFPPHQLYHPNALPYMYYPSHYGPYLQPPPYHGHFGTWNSQTSRPPPGFAQAHPSYPGGATRPQQQYLSHPLQVFQQPPPPPPRPIFPTSSAATPVVKPQALDITSSRDDPVNEKTLARTSSADPRDLALASPSSLQLQHPTNVAFVGPPVGPYGMAPAYFFASENPQSLAEASSNLSFESVERISLLLVAVALSCYAGVSPRTLPLSEYNLMFYENLRLVSLALIAPSIQLLSVVDARENDINGLVNTFFVSFTLGYVLTFVAEIIATTLVRLAVFHFLEPKIFSLAPIIPVPVLPWVLRDIQYRPKRITLFAVDFATSCVACPVIEEYIKLMLLRWTATLPRNFNWVTRVSTKNRRRKRSVAEPVRRLPGEKEVTTANKYVTQMLAVSLGLKLCDAGRRILLYTKGHQANKSFFAIFRGIFPIQELCGTLTALALAKRDLLGFYTPLWQILGPATVLHGMANYRGMKPIFKWNSATPWSEMQLYPLNFADSSTLPQLLSKGFGKFMWLVILGRVLGYCIKNYYMINRQAVKRTTTYAGKHSAFSAELETAELLKKQK